LSKSGNGQDNAGKGVESQVTQEYVTKEDLDKLIEQNPLEEGRDQMEINIPAKEFIKQMMEASSQTSIQQFYIDKGEQKV
jgi:hypothetical protein